MKELEKSYCGRYILPTPAKLQKRREYIHKALDRQEHLWKRKYAAFNFVKPMSFITNGPDQSVCGLPLFATESNDMRKHSLKVRPMVGRENAVLNNLFRLTMIGKDVWEASGIIETMHRFLTSEMKLIC